MAFVWPAAGRIMNNRGAAIVSIPIPWKTRKEVDMGSHTRKSVLFVEVLPLLLALLLAGCSGGVTGTGSSSASGSTVTVSLAAAPPNSAGVATASADLLKKPAPAGNIDNAWITIHRIALIPGDDGSLPDPDGEWSVEGSGPMDPKHVSADIAPVE